MISTAVWTYISVNKKDIFHFNQKIEGQWLTERTPVKCQAGTLVCLLIFLEQTVFWFSTSFFLRKVWNYADVTWPESILWKTAGYKGQVSNFEWDYIASNYSEMVLITKHVKEFVFQSTLILNSGNCCNWTNSLPNIFIEKLFGN